MDNFSANNENGTQAQSGVRVGFSDRVNNAEILEAVSKNRKRGNILSFIFVLLPLIGFTVYSFATDKMEPGEGIKYGAIISAVFFVFYLYSLIKGRAGNTYEAVVIDKKTRETYRHKNSDNDDDIITEYITVVRTTDGKKKKITEREGSKIIAWNYLNVGDRFKYHPQFNFPYEHYDKSRAPYIACVSCTTQNDPAADRCKKCGLPLLK